MDRRSFLKVSAAGGSAAAIPPLAAPAYATGKRSLTMVTSWGRGMAGVFDAATNAGECITALTDGQLTVDVKAAGELVGAFEVFDAVTSGQADLYHSADYYYLNQHPAYAFFAAVPFGMTATELNNWYYQGNGHALHDELGEIFGLKPFLAGNTGTQAGGWFRKEINSADDFQGLKFRMPGLGGKALGHMGASVQNVPGSEVYQALASGALDGTEWIGPWADEQAGFHEITKFYYAAGFHEPCAGLSLAMNRDVYDALTPSQKAAVGVAASDTNIVTFSQYMMNNGSALERLKSYGVKVLDFPEGVWDAMGEASWKVYDEYNSDDHFKRVFDDYMSSMKASSGWLTHSVSAYRAQRDRILG